MTIALVPGFNEITVVARDGAGNEATRNLTVEYVEPVTTPPTFAVTNLSAASGKNYQVVDSLVNGALANTDRSYTLKSIPAVVQGQTYIKTSMADDRRTENPFLTFDLNANATVYISFYKTPPSWATSLGFSDTGAQLIHSAGDVPMRLYAKDYSAGTVKLGGSEKAGRMYNVLIVPR